jgi:serine/threonine protein phosphatase PrpC
MTSCSSCGAPLERGDRFCESCGARVGTAPPGAAVPVARHPGCRACGAPASAIGEDGYCTVCGVRERPPGERTELDLGFAAAVSDQGHVHHRNEDAFHLEASADGGVAVVVCDGISSASASNVAAQQAAAAAGGVLAASFGDKSVALRSAMINAVDSAREAVSMVEWTTRADRVMPSCTLVAGVSRAGEVAIGWVGDSRAYWVTDAPEITQLTVDDSWAVEQVSRGVITVAQAEKDKRFHAITHWVGADAPERPPRVVVFRPHRRGRLLLCTDGLWNYAADPSELLELVDSVPSGAAPAALARSLTETALLRGGRDNVTVAVVDVEPLSEEAS